MDDNNILNFSKNRYITLMQVLFIVKLKVANEETNDKYRKQIEVKTQGRDNSQIQKTNQSQNSSKHKKKFAGCCNTSRMPFSALKD